MDLNETREAAEEREAKEREAVWVGASCLVCLTAGAAALALLLATVALARRP